MAKLSGSAHEFLKFRTSRILNFHSCNVYLVLSYCSHVLLNIYIGLDKQKFQRKIINIFLPIIFSMCFGFSKEPSH